MSDNFSCITIEFGILPIKSLHTPMELSRIDQINEFIGF